MNKQTTAMAAVFSTLLLISLYQKGQINDNDVVNVNSGSNVSRYDPVQLILAGYYHAKIANEEFNLGIESAIEYIGAFLDEYLEDNWRTL